MENSDHTDTKYYITVCPKCNIECHTLYGIRQHRKSCNGHKQLSSQPENAENNEVAFGHNAKCKICKRKFFLYKTLLDHYKQKHPHGNGLKNLKRKIKRKYGKHECNICHKKFAWKESLERHTSVIHSETGASTKGNTVQNQTSSNSPPPNDPHASTPHKPSSNPNHQANPFLKFNG